MRAPLHEHREQAEDPEVLATVLAVTRVRRRGLSQGDRVQALLDTGSPREVLATLAGEGLLEDPLLDQARRDVARWADHGYGVVSVLSDRYPQRLRDVREAPALVYHQGRLDPADQGVCVVGSRQADDAALRVAAHVSRALVEEGLTVVSGLATGVDAAAHTAALDAGGRTVAVMGTGLDRTYPAAHQGLREHVTATGGLVMTQLPPGPP